MKSKEKKQVEASEVLKPDGNKGEIKFIEELFPKEVRSNKIKIELDQIKKYEEKIRPKDLLYKTNKYKYAFQQYETIRFFSDSIYNGKISIDEAKTDESSLLDGLKDFRDRARLKTAEGKYRKIKIYKSAYALYES